MLQYVCFHDIQLWYTINEGRGEGLYTTPSVRCMAKAASYCVVYARIMYCGMCITWTSTVTDMLITESFLVHHACATITAFCTSMLSFWSAMVYSVIGVEIHWSDYDHIWSSPNWLYNWLHTTRSHFCYRISSVPQLCTGLIRCGVGGWVASYPLIIGASLSEPHINVTCVREIYYVYGYGMVRPSYTIYTHVLLEWQYRCKILHVLLVCQLYTAYRISSGGPLQPRVDKLSINQS